MTGERPMTGAHILAAGVSAQPAFRLSGYGFALCLTIVLRLTLIASPSVMTIHPRPPGGFS
jgi:hypothetical protein